MLLVIYQLFDTLITLDNPDVKIEDRIITIDDKNVNIIIDLDRKRGILDNGYLLQALLLIDKNGIYTIDYNSISDSRVLFTLDELYAMSDKTKRYLSNEFGIKLRLLNKAKIEKDDNLIVISYDSNKIRIEIDDTVRINVKNRVKELIIKEDKVYEMHDYILDYQSVNPFFNIYNESLKNHVENLTDFEDFILPWLALYKSIIIDGILHGLDNGMIYEYQIDALIIEASILSIKDHIEFYFRYKRSYVLLFLCVVVDELLHRILIDSENTTLYYPSLYDKRSIDEYILTSLLDSIFIMLTESMRNNILRKYKSYIESFKESTDIYYLHPTLIKILIISDLLSNIIDDSDTGRLLKELSSPIHYKIREVMLR
ncbi:MAG: hypothetical protein KatS3mg003_0838 [Candidatus Nitrosocaldaceae archaeon]|nr:MAG: hypothetical protein KatS3mg003_0838 [Candidatus Nitrosocaldaceae archaeon]